MNDDTMDATDNVTSVNTPAITMESSVPATSDASASVGQSSAKTSQGLTPKAFAGKYGAERIVRLLPLFESYGYVTVTDSGAEMLAEAKRIMSTPFGEQLDPADRPAALRLREWRLQKAREEKVSAFVIMSNKKLYAIAVAHPNTADELAVLGVPRKLIDACQEDILSAARRDESVLAVA